MTDFEIRNEEKLHLAACVWGWCARRLDGLPTGTSIRFGPSSGLVWAMPADGSDPFILGRCPAPLEWLS